MYEVGPDILEISKALGTDTRYAIFRSIVSSPIPLTVKALVAAFGMHHSAIRIHLNKLEEAGLIISRKQHQRGAVGRPQLAFAPSPEALKISLPPRNYEFLAQIMIDLALSQGVDEEKARTFGASWGEDFMRRRGRKLNGPLPLPQALDIVCEELRKLGATVQAAGLDGRGYVVVERNCVFSELASNYAPLICQFHQSIMRGMVNAICNHPFSWEQVSALSGGDDHCQTQVVPLQA